LSRTGGGLSVHEPKMKRLHPHQSAMHPRRRVSPRRRCSGWELLPEQSQEHGSLESRQVFQLARPSCIYPGRCRPPPKIPRAHSRQHRTGQNLRWRLQARSHVLCGRRNAAPARLPLSTARMAARSTHSEAAWRNVLNDLIARGLPTPGFLIVDGAAGLERHLPRVA
jgi:hypothetical protein